MDHREIMTDDIAYTEEILTRYLPKTGAFAKPVTDAMTYSVKAGGKRIRPVLMLETYRAFGGSDRKVVEPFMAAIEFIHTYSLVHDDLPCMDNDEYRRGKLTTWKAYGFDMAVLCGDALLNFAYETALKAFAAGSAEPFRVAEALSYLAEKAGIYGMVGGQSEDVEYTGRSLSEAQLDYIYRLKTSALLEASMVCGALLAGADEAQAKTVEKIAGNVGLTFQIVDDVLDCTSTTEDLGKPVGSDEKNEKTTYVTLFGIDAAREQAKRLTDEADEMLSSLNIESGMLRYIIDGLVNRRK